MADTTPTPAAHGAKSANAFAFCCLNGRQKGHVFPLTAAKVMLQFDSVLANGTTQPTRCLVIQAPNGVAVRTIEGEVIVNNIPQSDVWMEVGDEVTCGDSRLRLIRHSPAEDQAAPPKAQRDPGSISPIGKSRQNLVADFEFSADSTATSPAGNTDWYSPPMGGSMAEMQNHLPPDIPCAPSFAEGMEAGHTPELANYFADQSAPMAGTAGFFSRLTPDEAATEPPIGSATMCVNPDELRALLQPTVYGEDDAANDPPAPPPVPIAEELPFTPITPPSSPTQKSPVPTESLNPSRPGESAVSPADNQSPEPEDSIKMVERRLNALDSIVANDIVEPHVQPDDLLPTPSESLLETIPASQPVAHDEPVPSRNALDAASDSFTPAVESSAASIEETVESAGRPESCSAAPMEPLSVAAEEPTHRRKLTSDVIEVSCVEPYVLVVGSSEWACPQTASTIHPFRFSAQDVEGVILHW